MAVTNVAQQLVNALRELGVRHVFGVPSGGWVDYMEAMRKTDGIEFVLTSHEGGASFMADICGRLTGAPGVCFGTFGPGATNLSTGVGGALLDRSPVIALTDEMTAPMRGRVTQMGIDHQALFRPITKHTTRLEAGRVREIVFEAAREAMSGRPGSVHIGLPVGMSAEVAGDETITPLPLIAQPPAPEAQKDEMIRLFNAAKRPLIVLGLGAVHSRVGSAIARFAGKHRIPVVLTPMAKGMIPEDHPGYAGVLFHALSDRVGVTHQQSDLVVAIGYDTVEFNFEAWLPDVPLVNIDMVPADLDTGRFNLACDVTGSIRDSVDHLCANGAGGKDWDLEALAARRRDIFNTMKPRSATFGPCAALDVLREVLPPDGIMTCDVGAHTHLIGQKWPTPAPGLQIMTNGWSAMGFGLPAAIAAKICRPDTAVCAVLGDGGFLMTAGELATAVRLKLKIVIVVLSDNDLALIRIKQERKQNPIYGTPVRPSGTIGGPNIFGVPVMTAATPEQFRESLEKGLAGDGPVIVEAVVDSREYDDLVLKNDRG